MVIFIYEYGAAKPGLPKLPVYAGAVQVKDGVELDLALYTLYSCMKVKGQSPTMTPTKNGIRVTYSVRGEHYEESKD